MANIGNWIAENCSTGGTGPLILAGAVASATKFKDAVPAGEVMYSVIEGVNREAGIGDFDGNLTIVRSSVRATLFEGVFNDNSPSPIPLTGSSVVACTLNASAFIEVVSDIEQNAADIAQNAQGISDNAADILVNSQGISDNAADILVNAQGVSDNAAAILVNSQNISDNDQDISDNASAAAAAQATADAALPLAGGTMTGQAKGITPISASDLTRKDYVDGLDGANVKLTGNQTVNGVKSFADARASGAQPTNIASLTRKDYVDSNPTMIRTGDRLDITNVTSV